MTGVVLVLVVALTRVPPAVRVAPPVETPQAPVADPSRGGSPDARGKGRVVKFVCKLEILDHVMFAVNSAQLSPSGLELLKAMANTLVGNPQVRRLEVKGHQVAGERAGLSLVRAQAVAADLVGRGVKTTLIIKDLGRSEPTCKRAADSCSDQSRRVDFQILPEPAQAAVK